MAPLSARPSVNRAAAAASCTGFGIVSSRWFPAGEFCSIVTVPVSPELQRVEGDVRGERYQKMDVGGAADVELEEGEEN
jgi:hypothetical protein